MPFSDNPPQFVFPDTRQGRGLRTAMVQEEPILRSVTFTCGDYERTRHPVYTDDDLYRNRDVSPCARRKRDGVRDMNWCMRCIAGFPYSWQTKRDADRLSDFHSVTGF
jgi:hypothetical protein